MFLKIIIIILLLQTNFYVFAGAGSDPNMWRNFLDIPRKQSSLANVSKNPLAGLPQGEDLPVFDSIDYLSQQPLLAENGRHVQFDVLAENEDVLARALRITDEEVMKCVKKALAYDRSEHLATVFPSLSSGDLYDIVCCASKNGRLKVLKYVLSRDDVDISDRVLSPDSSVIHHLMATRDNSVLMQFLAKCFTEKDFEHKLVSYADRNGESLITLAIYYEKTEVVKQLLGIPSVRPELLRYKDVYQNTLMHLAAEKGSSDIVGLLIGVGNIDINSKNIFNKTALDVAREKHEETEAGKYLNIIYLLTEAQKSSNQEGCSCVVQ